MIITDKLGAMECPKCGSKVLSINVDGDYDCLCGYVIYTQPIDEGKQSERIEVATKKISLTGIQQEEPEGTDAYFDQHRDEILADRLSIGQGRTLTKWKIPHADWTEIKCRWREEGIVVPDLRSAFGQLRSTKAKAEVAKMQKKDTSPKELEQYGPGVTRDGFHAALEKVIEPAKDIDKGRVSRKDVVTEVEKPSKIRSIFRRLVSEGIEPSYEMADELLAKYLKEEAVKTIEELVGDKAFDITVLRKGMVRIYLEELLDSMPEFNKTSEGRYRYEKNGKGEREAE